MRDVVLDSNTPWTIACANSHARGAKVIHAEHPGRAPLVRVCPLEGSLARGCKPRVPEEAANDPAFPSVVFGLVPSPQVPREHLAVVPLDLAPHAPAEVGALGVDHPRAHAAQRVRGAGVGVGTSRGPLWLPSDDSSGLGT